MRDRFLTFFFVVLVALPVPLDRLLADRGVALPGRPFARSLGAIDFPADWLDGTAGTKAENRLMNRSHVARWVTARYAELMYLGFRRSPQAIRVGADGWLFVPERVNDRPAEHWDLLLREHVETFAAVDARLREHGGRLLVALVPDRARLNPDRAYFAGRVPEGRGRFLPDLVSGMAGRGVEAVSLEGPLAALRDEGRAPVYRDDHHWTSAGAERAALVLAERVGRARTAPGREAAFTLRWDPTAASPGSLIRKLGFAPGSRLEEAFRSAEPRLLLEGDGAPSEPPPWNAGCATYWTSSFGDLGSPYVFANALDCPVRIVLVRGQGSAAAPGADLARLREERAELRGHTVVWEIPEYHLVTRAGVPPTGWISLRKSL
jgi:hypothetical protein